MRKTRVILFLLVFMMYGVMNAEIASGTCGKDGDNITWVLNDYGTLILSGSGEMQTYSTSTNNLSPWYEVRESILGVSISQDITSIGDAAFFRCSRLASITIPNSVASIGEYAFDECRSLRSVEIPNSVVSIGHGAFRECIYLTSVTIPNSVTDMGDSAFRGCICLTDVTIGNSVKRLGNSVFEGCNLKSVTIPNSVTSVDNYAFFECSSLTTVTIPNSVTSIGNSAFQDCTSLTSVAIPNSVITVGYAAFSGCSALTTVTIGNSLKSLEFHAFYDCGKLSEMTCAAVEPPIAAYQVFDGTLAKSGTLHVPAESLEKYQVAETWFYWKNVEAIDADITAIDQVHSVVPEAMPDSHILLTHSDGMIHIEGAPKDALITVSTLAGETLKTCRVNNNVVSFQLPLNSIYIIKVGGKKLKMKI